MSGSRGGGREASAAKQWFDKELASAGLAGEDYESDTEFDASYLVDEAALRKDLDTVLVVENLPVVTADKRDKLTGYIAKIFSSVGRLAEDGVVMPMSTTTGQSEGFAFLEFATREDAEKAHEATKNGYKFDASHTLRVFWYETAREYLSPANSRPFVPPEAAQLNVGADLYSWLYDDAGRDEFALTWLNAAQRAQHEVLFSDSKRAPQLEFAGDRDGGSQAGQAWAGALSTHWSPMGTYLATLANRGVRLWSGSRFFYGAGFRHDGVNSVSFSPTEENLITWSGREDAPSLDRAAIVWDVRTGRERRAFRQRRREDDSCDMVWSACGRYLARLEYDFLTLKTELLRVYEAPAIALLDGRSTRVPGAVEISWCPAPASPLLAWWSPERESANVPASVQLLRFPSREVVRQRNFFNVESLQLVWQPDGAALAVLAARLPKKRLKGADRAGPLAPLTAPPPTPFTGSAGYTIEIFRLRERDVPVTVMEVAERVRALSWEPGAAACRFALVTESPALVNAFNISFYRVAPSDSKPPALLFTLEARPASSVLWSPRGDVALLAGAGGRYEFYDVERRKSLATVDHAHATGAAWDPSGRALASFKTSAMDASVARELVDNGYVLYTFQGVKYFETVKPKVLSFAWRPRPASMLSEEDVRAVTKNLKGYIARFQEEDKRAENRKRLIERLERRKTRDDFRARLAAGRDEWERARPRREALLGAPDVPGGDVIVEEIYERVLDEVTVVVA